MPPRGRLRTLAYALLPACALLAAAEIGLRALGLRTAAPDLSRGFDRAARYLVPDPEHPGALRTQMYEGHSDELSISPVGEGMRVLLFGGSNAQNCPVWLAERILFERLRTPIEFINLGRSGYGSGRVSILLEQAMELAPDLVLIYSGHNEFVEYGFELELAARRTPADRVAAGLASHLASFGLLAQAMRPDLGAAALRGPTPERSAFEHAKFAHFTYDRTLARYERYRENLRAMVRAALDAGAQPVLITLFGNEMVQPFVWQNPPVDLAPEGAARVRGLLREAVGLMPARFARLAPREPPDHPHPPDWRRGEGVDAAALPVLRPLRGDYAGLEPLWGTPTTWKPWLLEYLGAVADLQRREISADERAALERAAELYRQVLALVPDQPMAHYQLGLHAALLGDLEQAARELRLAARFDRAPLKASDLVNEIVRSVAAEFPGSDGASGAEVFELEARMRARAPDGILGWEIMMDHCHPHDRVMELLMRDFADMIEPHARAWIERGGRAAARRP